MLWVITQDHINGNDEGFYIVPRVGFGKFKRDQALGRPVLAKEDDSPEVQKQKEAARQAWVDKYVVDYADLLPYEIELRDGDNELYYTGLCGDLCEANEGEAFGPQDWAEGDAGVTTTMYRKFGTNDKWEML